MGRLEWLLWMEIWLQTARDPGNRSVMEGLSRNSSVAADAAVSSLVAPVLMSPGRSVTVTNRHFASRLWPQPARLAFGA